MNTPREGDEIVPMIEILLSGFSERARINALSAALARAIAGSCPRDGRSGEVTAARAQAIAAAVGADVGNRVIEVWYAGRDVVVGGLQ